MYPWERCFGESYGGVSHPSPTKSGSGFILAWLCIFLIFESFFMSPSYLMFMFKISPV